MQSFCAPFTQTGTKECHSLRPSPSCWMERAGWKTGTFNSESERADEHPPKKGWDDMKNINVKSHWLSRPVAACLLVGLLCVLPTFTQHAQIIGSTTATGFQGQAAAVSGIAAGSSVAVANTGSLALSGGALEASALEASLAGGLSAGVSHTAVIAGGNEASAEAAVANVSLTASGFLSSATTITADFVMSRV